MLAEFNAVIQGLNLTTKIIKGFSDLKGKVDLMSLKNDLLTQNAEVLTNFLLIQSSYQDLLESKNNIEEELKELKSWNNEKPNYDLKEIYRGVFVYIRKKPSNSTEPAHWLCANCFDTKHQKSIIQRNGLSSYEYICNLCKSKINIPESSLKKPPKSDDGTSVMSV